MATKNSWKGQCPDLPHGSEAMKYYLVSARKSLNAFSNWGLVKFINNAYVVFEDSWLGFT